MKDASKESFLYHDTAEYFRENFIPEINFSEMVYQLMNERDEVRYQAGQLHDLVHSYLNTKECPINDQFDRQLLLHDLKDLNAQINKLVCRLNGYLTD